VDSEVCFASEVFAIAKVKLSLIVKFALRVKVWEEGLKILRVFWGYVLTSYKKNHIIDIYFNSFTRGKTHKGERK
jgi:hypothetical protein